MNVAKRASPVLDVVAELRALTRRVAALEASRRAPRDAEDAQLRRVVMTSTKALPFTIGQLWAHAELDDGLRQALAAATIGTPYEAGCWLRSQLQIGPCDGLAVRRLRRRRWQLARVDTSDT